MTHPLRNVSTALASVLVLAACGSEGKTPTNPPLPPPPPAPNVLPTARFVANVGGGPAPLLVTFDGRTSNDPDGTIVSYSWVFGDGATGSGAEVSHTYTQPGFYIVELTVRDDRGDADSQKDSVYVESPPGPGLGRVQGTIWFDRDLDGIQGAGEPGLERFVVFLDENGDKKRDAGEALTFTRADGSYEFAGLDVARSYSVSQALPFGWSNTLPGPTSTGPASTGQAPAGPSAGTSSDGRHDAVDPDKLIAARIIGGEETEIDPFPFQAALLIGNFQFCGGTLINAEYVLSAAHCLDDKFPVDLEVLLGTAELATGGERVGVEAIRLHPQFGNSLDYDVALLRLKRPVLRPRVFLQSPDQPSLSLPGGTATVIGWGQTEDGRGSPRLLRTDLPIITNTECANSAGAFFGGIGERTICAGLERLGKGPCFGDSGGPLLVPYGSSWAQIGVVSFGVNVDQCGNIPAAFSRVSELYDYIVAVARVELSGAHVVDWAGGPSARADFGNFH